MSTFDADNFMNTTVDQPMSTEYLMVPEGTYQAMIDDFASTAFEMVDFEYKKGDRAGTPGTMLKFNIPFVILDETVKASLNRDKVTCEMQLIIDQDATGGFDWGPNKNIQLGRVRKAVNQNAEGPWSPAQLRGAGPCHIRVKHESFKAKDGTLRKASRVTEVAAIR